MWQSEKWNVVFIYCRNAKQMNFIVDMLYKKKEKEGMPVWNI